MLKQATLPGVIEKGVGDHGQEQGPMVPTPYELLEKARRVDGRLGGDTPCVIASSCSAQDTGRRPSPPTTPQPVQAPF